MWLVLNGDFYQFFFYSMHGEYEVIVFLNFVMLQYLDTKV